MSWAEEAAAGLVETFDGAVEGDGFVIAAAAVDAGSEAVATAPDGRHDAVFEIGSITKTITATLTASLVLDGTIGLDDEIGRWLAAGKNSSITVEQLATHSSGLSRLAPNAFEWPGFDRANPYAGYTPELAEEGLRVAELENVGEFRYSNFGYQLLGLLLERAAGETYSALAHRRIFMPLGMARARVRGDNTTGRLDGYSDGTVVPHWDQHLPGAGGVEATIADMVVFLRSVLFPPEGRVGDAIRLTREPRVRRNESAEEGLAWVIQGERLYWHNGGTGGFRSMLAFDAVDGRGSVALANSADIDDEIDRAVVLAVRGGDPRQARPEPPGPEWERSAREFLDDLVAGRYGEAEGRIAEQVREALSAERLKQAWEGLVAQAGQVTSVSVALAKKRAGGVSVGLALELSTGSEFVLYTFHAPDQGIAGATLKPRSDRPPW